MKRRILNPCPLLPVSEERRAWLEQTNRKPKRYPPNLTGAEDKKKGGEPA